MNKCKDIKERFESKFVCCPMSGCWLWIGNVDKDGYGEIKFDYIKYRAHRLSWQLYKRQIPEGLLVCHSCDVPACVNPNHLFIGTHTDNNQDMYNKKRNGTCPKELKPRGTDHGLAKLTEEQVLSILKDTRSQRAIAEAYNISQPTVGSIKRRETWRHVTYDATPITLGNLIEM